MGRVDTFKFRTAIRLYCHLFSAVSINEVQGITLIVNVYHLVVMKTQKRSQAELSNRTLNRLNR